MNKKLLILLTAVSVLTLSGCGAPKAPQPSGQKVVLKAKEAGGAENEIIQVQFR